jgi:nickel transport protein
MLRHGAAMMLMTAIVLLSSEAFAHALRLAAAPTPTGFAGRVFYSDDSPATAETVILLDAKGAEVGRTRTDGEGKFSLAAPAAGSFTLVAEGEEGHRVERAFTFSSAAAAADCGSAQELAAALRAELQPLREDLARYEQRIRFHDAIGGIGFIVGVAGAWALWAARRKHH